MCVCGFMSRCSWEPEIDTIANEAEVLGGCEPCNIGLVELKLRGISALHSLEMYEGCNELGDRKTGDLEGKGGHASARF